MSAFRSLFLVLFVCSVFTLHAQRIQMLSPNGKIHLSVSLGDKISWSATCAGSSVVESCEIGMAMTDRNLGAKPELLRTDTARVEKDIHPVVPVKRAIIHDLYKELTLTFAGDYRVQFRVYDDGIAYRFIDDRDTVKQVRNETMDIRFPAGTRALFPEESSMYSHNERLYLNKALDSIAATEFCSLPAMIDTKGGAKVLFTEAGLSDYPCMFLGGTGKNALQARFPKFVLEALPNEKSSPDRDQIISKEADYIAEVAKKRSFPWRVFMISKDDRTFVESNLVYQLDEDCRLGDVSWIKPGKVAWDWYNANNLYQVDFKAGLNTATYKYYIDFAAENGLEYVILDEGWSKTTTDLLNFNPDIDVAELIKYATRKKVGIILWVLWKPLTDNLTDILDAYAKWGVKGVKVDFMQRSDQAMVRSYELIAKETSKRRLLVDFHGTFKPAGLERMYPNVLTYEGVKGNENNKWSADVTPDHTLNIAFIRMAAGPMDFTPGAMRNGGKNSFSAHFERPMSLGTRCRQVAMYVLYESPLQMLCESPSAYKKEPETLEFIAKIPTTWDETRVLNAKVGDYLLIARRKGQDWYIGGMTDWEPREFQLDLSFLDANAQYEMTLMKDGVNVDRYAEDFKKEQLNADKNTKITLKMASGGGWAAILHKK